LFAILERMRSFIRMGTNMIPSMPVSWRHYFAEITCVRYITVVMSSGFNSNNGSVYITIGSVTPYGKRTNFARWGTVTGSDFPGGF